MDKPNVLLLVLDSARPDVLSPYSSEANTPNIEQLADEGVVFDNAFAPAPWTPPSHAALFTGKKPVEVGGTSPEPEIEQGEDTIASELSEKGYKTTAYHTAAHISKKAGYRKGFDIYKDVRNEYSRKKTLNPFMWADTLLNRIWGRKDRELFQTHLINKEIKSSDKPLFMFANYQTCHRPYAPHLLAKSKFGETSISGDTDQLIEDGKEQIAKKISDGKASISEADRQGLINLARAETYRADFYIGRIVKKLKKENMYENTVLIVTSDHGDNFGENNLFEHGYLSKENLHIPLIISGGYIEKSETVKDTVSTRMVKKFIQEVPQNQDRALESLEKEYVVSQLGESSIAQKHSFPWLDASISVTDGEHQVVKRKNFTDIEGKFCENGANYNSNIPSQKKKEMEQLIAGFDGFDPAGNDFNNTEDEKVKSKLADLGYT
jgi:arylsulfatase A-like enzyme